jgi:hypothetical protein
VNSGGAENGGCGAAVLVLGIRGGLRQSFVRFLLTLTRIDLAAREK